MAKQRTCVKWTQKELDFLAENVKKYGSPKGLRITSYRLKNRTVNACAWQYSERIKKQKLISELGYKPKDNDKKLPIVQFHNGSTVNAKIIVKRKDLIVAKHKNMVVTIDL